jgi:ubiquinone/menaquinone biosynthesis C-methylase UbiE
VLDVAIRQGLAAEAALVAVGPPGSVVASDISDAIVEQAHERLGGAPNAIIAVEDGVVGQFET